jgi:probable O-glycosylation ligase (exosortase A-associated)
VLLAAALLTDRWRIHAMVWAMVLSIGYFSVRGGIFTLVTGGRYIVMGPPNTMIDDRNHLAVAMLVVLPLMNYLRMQSPHKVVRTGLIVAMVLTLFAAVGSQSRGALISLVGGGAILWYRSKAKFSSGLAIGIAALLVLAFMPETWYGRMRGISNYEADGSAMGRVMAWTTAFNVAVARPLTGGGFRTTYIGYIVDAYNPGGTAIATHSIWFEVLGDHGFVVFGIWLGIILSGTYYALRIPGLVRGRPDLAWASDLARMAQVSIVAYVLGGTFLSLNYWDLFWTLMVVLAATHTVVIQAIRQPIWDPRQARMAGARPRPAYP